MLSLPSHPTQTLAVGSGLVDTILAPGRTVPDRLLQEPVIARQGVSRMRGMEEVESQCPEPYRLAPNAAVHQSGGKFAVLPPPALKILIEAVHGHRVGPPEGKIAGPYAFEIGGLPGDQAREQAGMEGVLAIVEALFKKGKMRLFGREDQGAFALRQKDP